MNPGKFVNALLVALLLIGRVSEAQVVCDPSTPQFSVDLSGQPNGLWTSTAVVRDGYCCAANGNDVCIRFDLLLDSAASGILFNIISGATPGGALFYQINCGPPMQIGIPICLDGPGPHVITFCKPGNNVNVYAIQSIPKPDMGGTILISEACTGILGTVGLMDTSIRWQSIPNNPLYNSFLSCTSGCDTVTVTPSGLVPPYVDYQVSGLVLGGCAPVTYIDTFRVYMVNTLAVQISPQDPVICYGMPPPLLTANISGGRAPYQYLWNTGATTASVTGVPGTYIVTIRDSMDCNLATDTIVVTEFVAPITANAGPDTSLCSVSAALQLNGIVTGTSTGTWLGGNGLFTPNRNILNATYTPTAGEISAGSVLLTLINTNTMGCVGDTDTIAITYIAQPNPVINGPVAVCEGDTVTYTTNLTAGNTYSWNVTGGTVINTNINNVTVVWSFTGTGTVQLTETRLGLCTETEQINITINNTPAPLIVTPQPVCSWRNVNASVSNPEPNTTYTWTIIGGSTVGPNTGTNITIQWHYPGTGTISLHAQTNAGCSYDTSMQITIQQSPAAVITGPDTVCAFGATVYSTINVPGYQYNWSVTGGTINTNNGSSIGVTWAQSGTGSVSLNVINSYGCDTAVNSFMVIAQQPAPVIAGTTLACTGESNTYNATSIADAVSMQWQANGGVITGPVNTPAVTVIWDTPGTGLLTFTATNAAGCDSTVQINVQVLTKPAPQITGPDSACAMTTQIFSTPYIPTNNLTWSVSGGIIMAINTGSVTVQWGGQGSGTITLTETNGFCDSTISFDVQITPRALPVISGLNNSCIKTNQTYSVNNPQPTSSYFWSVQGGTILGSSTADSIRVCWSNSGTATISLTETTIAGCDSTTTLQVAIAPLPVPAISGDTELCQFDIVNYLVPQIPGHVYRYNITNGQLVNTSPDSITVNWNQSGTGTIQVTEEYPDGCDSTIILTVTIGIKPNPSVSGPVTMCEAETALYQAAVFSGSNVNWSVTGGNSVIAPNGTNASIHWNTPGSGSIVLTETTSLNCSTQVTLPVQVFAKPHPVLNGSTVGCIGNDNYTYTSGLTSGTHQWSVSGGNYQINGNSITVTWFSPGYHTVRLTVTDPLTGCDSTVQMIVQTDSLQRPVVNAGTGQGCAPLQLQFSGNQVNPNYNYFWDFGNGLVSLAANPVMVYTEPGTYPITLIVTNNTGCADTAYQSVQVYNTPVALFNAITDPGAYFVDMPYLTLQNQSQYATSYIWSFGNGDSSNLFEPPYQYSGYGNFTITLLAMNNNGCRDSISREVQIKLPEIIYVPNAFTPNHDGMNDNWSISTENITTMTVAIYNRWGHKIYTSDNPAFSWDGTYNGAKAPEGVYVYQLNASGLHGKSFEKTGTLTLYR